MRVRDGVGVLASGRQVLRTIELSLTMGFAAMGSAAIGFAALGCAAAPEPPKPVPAPVAPVEEPTVEPVEAAAPEANARAPIGSKFVVDPDEPLPKGAVARCGTTRMRAANPRSFAVSKTGVVWAVDSAEYPHLVLRDLTRGLDVAKLPDGTRATLAPDASYVVMEPFGEKGVVAFFSVPKGARIGEVKVPLPSKIEKVIGIPMASTEKIDEIHVAPDGRGVVVVTSDGAAHLIDPTGLKLVKTTRLPPKHRVAGLSGAGSRAVLEQGNFSRRSLFTLRYREAILGYAVVDLRSGATLRKETYKLPPVDPTDPDADRTPAHAYGSLGISLDGATVFRTENMFITAIDVKTGKETELDGFDGRTATGRLRPNFTPGRMSVLGDGEHAIVDDSEIVNLTDPDDRTWIDGPLEAVSPDGNWIVTRHGKRYKRSPDDIEARAGHDQGITDLAFSADDDLVVMAHEPTFWDTAECDVIKRRAAYGQIVATASKKGMVFLDAHEPVVMDAVGETRKLDLGGDLRCAAFSPHGDRLFLGLDGDTKKQASLVAVDLGEGASRSQRERKFPSRIRSIAVAPDGSAMAILVGEEYGPDPLSLELFSPDDLSTTKQRAVERAHRIAFAGAGTIVHSHEYAGLTVRSLPGLDATAAMHRDGCCRVMATSPDGKLVAGASKEAFHVWEVATRKLMGAVKIAHREPITAMAFSGDSRFLATGSDDTTVLFWNVSELTVPSLSQKVETKWTGADAKRFFESTPSSFRIKADGTLEVAEARFKIKPPPLKNVTRVVSVYTSHCAIADGKVRCWGSTSGGVLGVPEERGKTKWAVGERASPTTVAVTDPVDLRIGGVHACALQRDTNLICWGQLGQKKAGVAPAKVLSGVKSFAVMEHEACAVGNDGLARCWTETGATPQPLPLKDVTAIAGSRYHKCALDTAGKVRCMGSNEADEVGDDTGIERKDFVVVVGVDNAVAIAAGSSSTCALAKDGAVFCWGRIDGENIPRPTRMTALDGSTAIRMEGSTVCGLRGDKADCLKLGAD